MIPIYDPLRSGRPIAPRLSALATLLLLIEGTAWTWAALAVFGWILR